MSKYRWETPCKPLPHTNWKRTQDQTYLCQTCGEEHKWLVDKKTNEKIQ